MSINEKLALLRLAMQEAGIHACIIPGNDPHNSEYVTAHWNTRPWISGFNGSAGLIVVTADKAGLWTDSRYFIQAEEELAGSEIELHKQLNGNLFSYINWLEENLANGSVIGIDARLFYPLQLRRIKARLNKHNIKYKKDFDPFKKIWQDRPPLPNTPVFDYSLRYAGESRSSKIKRIRNKMLGLGIDYYPISRLDDIAWLLNLRGSDIEHNPVFMAYFLIEKHKSLLFIDESKLTATIKTQLQEELIEIRPYNSIKSYLLELDPDLKVLVEPWLNLQLFDSIAPDARVNNQGLIEEAKAIKNSTEIQHLQNAMLKDGIALCKAFMWLEQLISSELITEYDFAMQLAHFRRDQSDYKDESFPAIVGYKANAAIVHYRPKMEDSKVLEQEGLLLVDSGGQYLDGTTDITRTISLGSPSLEQKELFTYVLKGHIALATSHFPEGTSGGQLDALARQFLWKKGFNYGHGTGHGVGFFLNVHEGPQGITPRAASLRGKRSFVSGMLTSNEPGFYKADDFGIRIENLILCTESEYDGFLKFQSLSLFPIDSQLIETSLLTQEEIDWLNNYHLQVYQKLSPHLEETEKDWLSNKCKSI